MVIPGGINAATGETVHEHSLYVLEDGTSVYGTKAYWNGKYSNVQFNNGGAIVQLSISKISGNGDNSYPCTKQEAKEALDKVYNELQYNGICLDWKKGVPSRVDTFQNLTMDYPFSKYIPLFESLKPSRLTNRTLFISTYRYQNRSKQVELYDKREEMLKRGVPIPEDFPENCLRVEFRCMKGATSKKVYGVETVEELINKWDEFPVIFKKNINKTLFLNGLSNHSMKRTTERGMRAFALNRGRNAFSDCLKFEGAKVLLKKLKTAEIGINTIMIGFENDRKTATQKYNSMMKMVAQAPVISSDTDDYQILYKELYTKINAI